MCISIIPVLSGSTGCCDGLGKRKSDRNLKRYRVAWLQTSLAMQTQMRLLTLSLVPRAIAPSATGLEAFEIPGDQKCCPRHAQVSAGSSAAEPSTEFIPLPCPLGRLQMLGSAFPNSKSGSVSPAASFVATLLELHRMWQHLASALCPPWQIFLCSTCVCSSELRTLFWFIQREKSVKANISRILLWHPKVEVG